MTLPAISRLLTARVPAAPVTLARILVALAALLEVPFSWRDMERLVQPMTLRLPYIPGMPVLTPAAVPVLTGVWLAAGILFALGWRTRWAGSLLAATLLAIVLSDAQTYSNHLYLLGLIKGVSQVVEVEISKFCTVDGILKGIV